MRKDDFLTESKLGDYLKEIFPNEEFIRNRIVPNSGIRNRADYRNDELMLIVEFDGYRHYSDVSVIIIDEKKIVFTVIWGIAWFVSHILFNFQRAFYLIYFLLK